MSARARIEAELLARHTDADPWVDPENDRLALLYELDGCRTEIARLRVIERLARDLVESDIVERSHRFDQLAEAFR